MLFMVVETFKGGNPRPVYERLQANGRQIPEGVRFVNSWVEESLGRCWQVMECADRAALDAWMARWADLVDFEVVPVITSAEAQTRACP